MVGSRPWSAPPATSRAALSLLLALLIATAHAEAQDQSLGRVIELEKELESQSPKGAAVPKTGETGLSQPSPPAWKQEEAEFILKFQDKESLVGRRKPLHAGCDLWSGRWVYDTSYPVWPVGSCPLGVDKHKCSIFGRTDNHFTHFRWQPDGCTLPRFDAARMRESLRGKRVIFIGDSLALNQWQSFICLLATGLPDPKKEVEENFMYGRKSSFRRFNFTVELYWSRFLVKEREVPPHVAEVPHNVKGIVDTETMDLATGMIFTDARKQPVPVGPNAIVVLNSGHWWLPDHLSKKGVFFLAPGGTTVNTSITIAEGYEASMRTAAAWLQTLKARGVAAFWRGYSPMHFGGGNWKTGGKCGAKWPLQGWTSPSIQEKASKYYGPVGPLADQVMKDAGIGFLDIHALSMKRPDGHPQFFYNIKNASIADCTHWCLPGVPDVWNELFLAHLTTHNLISSSRWSRKEDAVSGV